MSINAKTTILGNLTREPVQNTVNGTTVVSFTVAVSTSKKDGDKYIADFYNVSVWGKSGEWALPRLQKGTQVWVTGEQLQQPYKDKNGVERTSVNIKTTDITLLARQKEAPSRNNNEENTEEPF